MTHDKTEKKKENKEEEEGKEKEKKEEEKTENKEESMEEEEKEEAKEEDEDEKNENKEENMEEEEKEEEKEEEEEEEEEKTENNEENMEELEEEVEEQVEEEKVDKGDERKKKEQDETEVEVVKESEVESTKGRNRAEKISFIIVGDNLDKTVSPRDMRLDSQVQSLHYFNSFAALDRIDTSHLGLESSVQSAKDIMAIPLSAFVPTHTDCTSIRSNYIVLAARVITEQIPYFKFLNGCVPNITHAHSAELVRKSETVSSCSVTTVILLYMRFLYFNLSRRCA